MSPVRPDQARISEIQFHAKDKDGNRDANERISSLSVSISLTAALSFYLSVSLRFGRTYADEEEEDAEHVEDRKQRQRKAGNDLISYYIYIYIIW